MHVESIDARDVALPANCAVLLFQSVRELLMNVVEHGAVKTATVRMTSEGGSLRIVVRDEGGFTLAAAAADRNVLPLSSKFGLYSIRERMAALGGTFDIRSAPGQGTTATLMLPHGEPRHGVRGSLSKPLPAQDKKKPPTCLSMLARGRRRPLASVCC